MKCRYNIKGKEISSGVRKIYLKDHVLEIIQDCSLKPDFRKNNFT
jgi:hypothetical protein